MSGAIGIDFAACSTYKWLMGVKGFGFFYVRKDLQNTVVKPTQHSGGVRFHYAPWVEGSSPAEDDITFQPRPGPQCYEVSYPSVRGRDLRAGEPEIYPPTRCAEYTRSRTGADPAAARGVTRHGISSRLRREGNESPIIVFRASNPAETMKKLRAAGVHVAMRFGNKMRISPSVFSNQEDIDRLLRALA